MANIKAPESFPSCQDSGLLTPEVGDGWAHQRAMALTSLTGGTLIGWPQEEVATGLDRSSDELPDGWLAAGRRIVDMISSFR